MSRIKGWSKVLELPYRVDYANRNTNYKPGLGVSDVMLIVNARDRTDELTGARQRKPDLNGRWSVSFSNYRRGENPGRVSIPYGIYPNKETALKAAQAYMKAHPRG